MPIPSEPDGYEEQREAFQNIPNTPKEIVFSHSTGEGSFGTPGVFIFSPDAPEGTLSNPVHGCRFDSVVPFV